MMNAERVLIQRQPAALRSIGDRMESAAVWLDSRPAIIVALLAVVYVALISPSIHRHLWYDELHTLYIAQAKSVHEFVDEIGLLDLNPPLSYLLVRASIQVFGPTEVATRLPAILGYFAGSLALLIFVARRAGTWWGAAAAGLFWYNQFFYFSTEARPYGILIGFLGLTLVSWDYVVTDQGSPSPSLRRWALAGVAAGTAGMLLTHVYAALWVLPFLIGSLIRDIRRERIDHALWVSLIVPFAACLTYIPLLRNVGQAVFPSVFEGSWERGILFYLKIFFQLSPALVAASVVAFAIAFWRRTKAQKPSGVSNERRLSGPEFTVLVAAMAPPAVIDALAIREHVAFYDRHAILTVPMMVLIFALFIAREAQANRLAGMAAAFVILGLNAFLPDLALARVMPKAEARESRPRMDIDQIDPELPVVASSALNFLEVDHYGNPALLGRLYYLVDADASIKYAHSNLTEGMLVLKQYFPIRANVSTYGEFVSSHRHFLVWGNPDGPGWLLQKLKAEGDVLTKIGDFDTPYPDSQLYEATIIQ